MCRTRAFALAPLAVTLLCAACPGPKAPAVRPAPDVAAAPPDAGRPPSAPRALAFDVQGLSAIAARDGRAYFATRAGIATEDGLLVATPQPQGIAVDADWIYWTDLGGNVARRRLTGGDVVTLATGQAGPSDLAVHGGVVYWVNGGTRERGNADGAVLSVPAEGGAVTTLAAAEPMPVAIAVDDDAVYWASFGSVGVSYQDGAIRTAPRTGGAAVTLAGDQPGPRSIALDGTHVTFGNYYEPLIKRVARAGGDAEVVVQIAVTTVAGRPSAVAVDHQFVYWLDLGGEAAEYGNGALRRRPKRGGETQTLAEGQPQPNALALDAVGAYWTNLGGMGGPSEVMALRW